LEAAYRPPASCFVAIAPSGVWLIDSKRYKGKVAVSNPLFGKVKLTIAGRDKSNVVDGLDNQVAIVRAAMESILPEAPVHGVLCFVDADLPMFSSLSFRGYPLLYPRARAKRINTAGPLTSHPGDRRGIE
jgi:Nuclease-related domain